MTVGGNGAHFFDIATSCIYHQKSGLEWGPDYADDPKSVGACANAIYHSSGYITGPNDGEQGATLGRDLIETVDDMLKTSAAKARKGFTLYVTGYAHFSNLEDDELCNNASFGARPGGDKPKLSHALREDVNHLTTAMNDKIQEIAGKFQNVKYISVTEGFDGHRFCEKNHALDDQYFSSDVWLWNLVAPGFGTLAELDSSKWVDWLNKNASDIDPNGGHIWNGWHQRLFYPRQQGHQVIANAIIAQMQADKLPGVKPKSGGTPLFNGNTPSPAPFPKPTSASPQPPPKPTCPKGKLYGTDTRRNKGECAAAGGTCQCNLVGVGGITDACFCRC
jgi:hypothetical protein